MSHLHLHEACGFFFAAAAADIQNFHMMLNYTLAVFCHTDHTECYVLDDALQRIPMLLVFRV